MLANVTSGSGTMGVVMGGGKDGTLYILNQAALGGYTSGDGRVASDRDGLSHLLDRLDVERHHLSGTIPGLR